MPTMHRFIKKTENMKKLPYESGFFAKITRKATNMERLSYIFLLLLMQQTKWHGYSFVPLKWPKKCSGPWTKSGQDVVGCGCTVRPRRSWLYSQAKA